MTANEAFDKIYCVNLDHRNDRWNRCEKVFEHYGLEVERFSAVKGNPSKIKTKIKKGAVGCLLSHLNILKDAKEKGYARILIFEDDIELVPNFNERFSKTYPNVPKDWQMLYLSANHRNKPQKIAPGVGKVIRSLTTHAYAVQDTFYDELIQLIKPCQMPVDRYYTTIQKKKKVYAFIPFMGNQRSDFSDIEQRKVSYGFMIKRH